MTSHFLIFPDWLADHEQEVEAKGWFTGAQLIVSGRCYHLTFYDPVRLSQDVASEFETREVFFEPNLIIVRAVTRRNMEQAAEFLVSSGNVNALVTE